VTLSCSGRLEVDVTVQRSAPLAEYLAASGDGELVQKRIRIGARESLDQVVPTRGKYDASRRGLQLKRDDADILANPPALALE